MALIAFWAMTLPIMAQLDDNAKERYNYFFLESVVQQNRGNLTGAFELLRHAQTINPNAPEVYYNLAGYYVTLNNSAQARACFQKAAALAPNNSTYLERLGQFYINSREYDKAIDTYERLYATHKNRSDVIETLFRLYAQEENPDKMIEMLNRLEVAEGGSEQITLSKMQIYEQLGKKGKQLEELKSLVDKHPNDLNYRTMLSNWLLQNGKTKEALVELKKVLKAEPDNVAAQMSLLDYYHAVKQEAKANELLTQLLKSKHTPTDTKVTLLQDVITKNIHNNNDDSVKTMRLIDDVLAHPQDNAGILLLKAAYMTIHQWPTIAIDSIYEQALAVEPDNLSARIMLLQDLADAGNYDKIIAVSKPGIDYNPKELVYYYLLGFAQYQKHDNEEALATFRKGATQINKDSNAGLVSDLYAIMGDLLHEKNDDAAAFACYDSCLIWKADNYLCMNNYAYYLAVKGQDLERAEQMSYKTVQNDSTNSTYLDTYSWVLFQEGRYAEAKAYIDKAIANDSAYNNIAKEHAGDIYAMNGDINRAVLLWTMAAENDKNNALLQKKIKLKRYIKE